MTQTKNKNNYKATFILDTRNYQEPVETLIDRLKDTITAIDGEVAEVENLGQQEFVRVTDRRFPSGIYVQISFAGPSDSPRVLGEKLRLDRTVNRILVQSLN